MVGADRDRRSRRAERPRGGGEPARGGGSVESRASEVPPGELLAAICGVALAVLMLFDWFGGANAWQLQLTDLLLLLVALFAVAVAAGRAAGWQRFPSRSAGALLTVAGGIALGAMLTLVLESSGGTVPLVLSLVAAGGILGGGLLELRPRS